jgi:hypothetical protein
MDLLGKILLGWGVLSIPAALFVGAFIKAGNPSGEPTPEERQIVHDVFDGVRR